MLFRALLVLALLVAAPAAAQTSGAISPQRMSEIVRTLAQDDFAGRAPGGPGGPGKSGFWPFAPCKSFDWQV